MQGFQYVSITQSHPCWHIFKHHKMLGRWVYVPTYWSRNFTPEEIETLEKHGLTGKQVYVCKVAFRQRNGNGKH